eukprot:c5186_g1_i1.p1 GENE.c5186_g1_i1~~c5186_g1_i1.p1  ORF type:complete len:256 (+),score=44.86 c5186_g1_i1:40-807(+)
MRQEEVVDWLNDAIANRDWSRIQSLRDQLSSETNTPPRKKHQMLTELPIRHRDVGGPMLVPCETPRYSLHIKHENNLYCDVVSSIWLSSSNEEELTITLCRCDFTMQTLFDFVPPSFSFPVGGGECEVKCKVTITAGMSMPRGNKPQRDEYVFCITSSLGFIGYSMPFQIFSRRSFKKCERVTPTSYSLTMCPIQYTSPTEISPFEYTSPEPEPIIPTPTAELDPLSMFNDDPDPNDGPLAQYALFEEAVKEPVM